MILLKKLIKKCVTNVINIHPKKKKKKKHYLNILQV
jgi:hypothetical protein